MSKSKEKELRVFMGKAIHPNFTKKDDDLYYLKKEVDDKIKKIDKIIDKWGNGVLFIGKMDIDELKEMIKQKFVKMKCKKCPKPN